MAGRLIEIKSEIKEKKLTTIGKNGVIYELIDGIVNKDEIIDKERFRKLIIGSAKEGEVYNKNILTARIKWLERSLQQSLTIVTSSKNIQSGSQFFLKQLQDTNIDTIQKIEGDLNQCIQIFSTDYNNGGLFKAFGGSIDFMLGYYVDSKEVDNYHLYYVPSNAKGFQDITQNPQNKRLKLLSSLNSVKNLANTVEGIKEITNTKIKNHFQGFLQGLGEKPLSEDRIYIYVWAYYHARSRYYMKDNETRRKMDTYGSYLIGSPYHGQAQEAFITHMALMHSESDYDEFTKWEPVITEYGGYASSSLMSLLRSATGNVPFLHGGDNIIANEDGQIMVNIQSKASKAQFRSVVIKYTQIIKNMIQLYQSLLAISQKDINDSEVTAILDSMFDNFKAQIWVPQKTKEGADNMEEKSIKKIFNINN